MSVLEFRKARESRNVVRTMLGKYLHIVLFTKTRYSSFLNHNFSKISNIKEQILLWGIIGEANFTFLNLKYEEIHISHPSVYFAGFWTQNKQDPVSTMQRPFIPLPGLVWSGKGFHFGYDQQPSFLAWRWTNKQATRWS